jgi:hypothetical protein
MSRKARKEASLNYMSVGIAFLSLTLMVLAGLLPYWITFPNDAYSTWPLRNFGLLKLSGRFTSVFLTGADLTWIEVRDGVCAASQVWQTGASAGPNAVLGMASAVGSQLGGAACPPMCKSHLGLRCLTYYKFTNIGFAVFGMIAGGGLTALVGAGMPLIGKERKRDRLTWMALELVGFILASGGCALYYFIFTTGLFTLRQSSWYQKESLGWCFMLACVGAALLIVPVFIQLSKVLGDKKKEPESAQLLTAGASPDFVMPSAI